MKTTTLKKKKKIHILFPTQGLAAEQQREIELYLLRLRAKGHEVSCWRDSIEEDDPTGYRSCIGKLLSMQKVDEVHVFWDVNSVELHFDLGLLFMKAHGTFSHMHICAPKVVLVRSFNEEVHGQSYIKVMQEMERLWAEKEDRESADRDKK